MKYVPLLVYELHWFEGLDHHKAHMGGACDNFIRLDFQTMAKLTRQGLIKEDIV